MIVGVQDCDEGNPDFEYTVALTDNAGDDVVAENEEVPRMNLIMVTMLMS